MHTMLVLTIIYYHLINDGGSIRGKLVPTVSLVQIEKKNSIFIMYVFFKKDINNNIILYCYII